MSDSELEDGEIREEDENGSIAGETSETEDADFRRISHGQSSGLDCGNEEVVDSSDDEECSTRKLREDIDRYSLKEFDNFSETANNQKGNFYGPGRIEKDGEICFISSKSQSFLSKDEIVTMLHEREFLSHSLPKNLARESPGTLIYLIDEKCFGTYKDVGLDCLSPWNTSNKVKPEVKHKWDDIMKVAGNLTLRQGRGFNPRNKHVSRKVSFLVDKYKNLASAVLFQYVIKEAAIDIPIPYSLKGVRTPPSQMEAVRTALANRTTTLAKRHLEYSGVTVSKKVIYNAAATVPSVEKQRCGRKKATNPDKVLLMACRNPHISFRVCGSEVQAANKVKEDEPDLEIIQTFPDAISVFIKSCPRREKLLEHKRAIGALDTMSIDESGDFLESLRASRTVSQTIPGFGCQFMVDTTFDISHLLVTIAVGVLDSVVDRKTGKNKMLLLGVMLHQTKKAAHHQEFGKRIAAQMLKFSKERKVPSFIADGELALQAVAQGEPFDECTRLLCDIHAKGNLKTKFKKDGERFAELLFGRTKKVDGVVTYYPGLFGALNREEFNRMIEQDLKEEPELVKWLKHQDYFSSHSLRSKLEGGLLNQWNTTNLLECFNNQIKIDIKNRMPGEELLAYFQKIHKEQMKNVFGAHVGGDSPFRLAVHRENGFRNEEEWSAMSEKAKDQFMGKVGLVAQSDGCSEIKESLPEWILEGSQTHAVRLLDEIKNLVVGFLDGEYIVKREGKSDGMATVRSHDEKKTIECTRVDCKNKSTKKPCAHVLAVLLSWSKEKSEGYFSVLYAKYNSSTSKQIVSAAIRPSDGGKYSRKGYDSSRGNHARRLDVVSRTTVFQQKAHEVRSPVSKKRKDDEDSEFRDEGVPLRSRRERTIGARKLFSP